MAESLMIQGCESEPVTFTHLYMNISETHKKPCYLCVLQMAKVFACFENHGSEWLVGSLTCITTSRF